MVSPWEIVMATIAFVGFVIVSCLVMLVASVVYLRDRIVVPWRRRRTQTKFWRDYARMA